MLSEPKRIFVSADGAHYLARLTWTGWGTPTARATGLDEVDNCLPDCAQGTFTGYPVKVTVTALIPYGSQGLQGYSLIDFSAPSDPYSPGGHFSVFPGRTAYHLASRPTPPPLHLAGVTSVAGGYLVNCSVAQCTDLSGAGPAGTTCEPSTNEQFCPVRTEAVIRCTVGPGGVQHCPPGPPEAPCTVGGRRGILIATDASYVCNTASGG
jgi:hypothetical protein